LLINQGLCPVSRIQVMSRCAGAGREHSQAGGPSWPVEILHTMGSMLRLWMGIGWAMGMSPLFSVSSNPLWSWSLVFFGNFTKFTKFVSSGFCSHCLGAVCNSIVRWWESCILYSLGCIFISSSSSINVSFVVLLNCLYLSPQVSSVVHIASPSCWGGRGGVREQLSSVSCWLLG